MQQQFLLPQAQRPLNAPLWGAVLSFPCERDSRRAVVAAEATAARARQGQLCRRARLCFIYLLSGLRYIP